MLYTTVTSEPKNEVYKELVNKLNAGGNVEEVYREIKELCESCRPSSPIACVELCQIWKLKREYRNTFEALEKKPNLTDLLNLLENDKRLRIIEILIEKPHPLQELRDQLEEMGYSHSAKLLRDKYVKPLADAGLIEEESGLLRVTANGESIYNIFTKSEVTKLSLNSKGYEEKILKTLLSEPKPYDDLAKIVPTNSLYRSLNRLQRQGLVAKANLSGHMFYYRTKRRPTRKLSQPELAIFTALPKEGMSVRDLSEKAGMNAGSVYKYLKRLRYKRHVRKDEKAALYELTDAGKCLAQSLNVAHNLIQG